MTAGDVLFETERLFVRSCLVDDAEAAFAIHGDPEVAAFIRDAPEESIETQRQTLLWLQDKFMRLGGAFGFWAIVEKASGEIVGSVALKPLPAHAAVEVGYHLGRRVWGKG